MSHQRVEHATVRVLDATGAPLPEVDVTLQQRTHAFGFGNIGFDLVALANDEQAQAAGSNDFGRATANLETLAELWLDVFNLATLPFYWGGFEPERGHPDTARLQAAARWFRARGVRTKGHPLVWHTVTPSWLLELPVPEIEDVLRGRVRREVTDFRGLIDAWDAINETVIMPVFENGDNGVTELAKVVGRQEMIRLAFEEARALDPAVELHINDFDLSPDYERVIEETLGAGIRIDAIGLQTHMHQGFRGEEALLEIVDRFARFGIPLHMTETTLLSGDLMPPDIVDLNDYVVDQWPSTEEGEARQADEIERHYRTLVGHPAVHSITYWGLTDDGAWLNAPSGLVRSDGTPKPSYDRLRSLVKDEWWMSRTTLRTSADGTLPLAGFAGAYELTLGDRSTTVALGTEPHFDVVLAEGRRA